MKYCSRLKKILISNDTCYLHTCIFWNLELQKCTFNSYECGLKKGKDEEEIDSLEIGGA
jgi:hypothetical protein